MEDYYVNFVLLNGGSTLTQLLNTRYIPDYVYLHLLLRLKLSLLKKSLITPIRKILRRPKFGNTFYYNPSCNIIMKTFSYFLCMFFTITRKIIWQGCTLKIFRNVEVIIYGNKDWRHFRPPPPCSFRKALLLWKFIFYLHIWQPLVYSR